MFSYLPTEIQEALDKARRLDRGRKARLRILADDRSYPVIRLTHDGFSLPEDAPRLRGLVDLYEGARHVAVCLVVASEEAPGEMRYEYKRHTLAADRPAPDFACPAEMPVALLPR